MCVDSSGNNSHIYAIAYILLITCRQFPTLTAMKFVESNIVLGIFNTL